MKLAIGIDPGVTTGVAVWSALDFVLWKVESMNIIAAMNYVLTWRKLCAAEDGREMIVIVEDARKRKWSGGFAEIDEKTAKHGAGAREGVGSVKRDCSIWEEFLRHHEIPFEMRYPRTTKLDAAHFQLLTKWTEQTNKHSRDAAMIVFQLNKAMLSIKLKEYEEQREREREQALHPRERLSREERLARAAGTSVARAIRYSRRRR